MAEFNLTQVTVPTPQPYDANDPTRQVENLCYVALQLLALAKDAEFVVRDNLAGVETKLDELKWNTILLDLWPLGKVYGQYHGPAVHEG